MAIDLVNIAQSISKTGFKLEYEIGQTLRKNGWHLISNRCYIDDLEGTVREIDLLAYKVTNLKDLSIYTVIIISCKKNEANSWALLSRPVDDKDPNYNWRPFKGWTNHPAIHHYMSKMTWSPSYHEKLSKACPMLFSAPNVDVFAFQEMSKANSSPQNDKNIFSSITSLMKAQSYEMSILKERQKNKKRIYQFNLASIIESELVRVLFQDNDISAESVNAEDYLCRYILNQKEEVARIKFITASAFPDILRQYSIVHASNCEFIQESYDKFYRDAYKDWSKTQVLLPDFNTLAKPALRMALYRHTRKFATTSDLSLSWSEKKEALSVDIDADDIDLDMVAKLNQDKQFKKEIATAMANVFHYEGDFSFDIGIPF
ncbi:hypothetical protein E5170_08565 [Pseudomonas atacamensis]|uniref:Uncharacterized protein n=2 Tax=Pseudomonas TaxID=286 RepID=A0AAQ2DF96_9PSED|nr:hypothetical protein [Pseudomonas atacamensis]THF34313.1 hypothetical protein E5170_08565 [Pseudomonas atacamensis]